MVELKLNSPLIPFFFPSSSFAPILRLISGCDVTAIHHWATWALANLCNVDGKYIWWLKRCSRRCSRFNIHDFRFKDVDDYEG